MVQTIPFGGQSSPQTIPFGGSQSAPAQSSQQSPSETIWSQISGQFNAGAQQFASGVDELRSAPQITAKISSNPTDNIEAAAQVAQAGAHGVATLGKAVGGVGAAALSPLAPVFNAGKKIGTDIGNKTPDSIAQPFAETLQKNPIISQQASDVLNMANLAFPDVAEKGTALVRSAKEKIVGTPEEQAASKVNAQNQAVTDAKAQKNKQMQSIATDWQAPAKTNAAGFNKPRDVLAQSPETPTFLGQLGIDPKAHIVDGKYATEDTAASLRDTPAKLSSETLRPSLKIADFSTPKTPVSEISAPSNAYLEKTFHVPADDAETIKSMIATKVAALERKYPTGMGLTEMHDEKITYSKGGGFSPFKSAADTNTAIANRALADSLAKTVQAKAPPDIPVKEFDAELSKYYKAADYLDSLNTKKAPVTFAQQIARGIAKFGGAAIGGHFGGGVVSEFAGYQIGKAIETSLENLTGQARAHFINNLQRTNPEAFTQVQKFLKDMTSGNTGTPRLNAPKAIIPEAPSVESQMSSRAATIQSKESSPLDLSQAQANPPKTAIKSPSMASNIPPEAEKAIQGHLDSAKQILDEMPHSSIEENGGVPALLERTKTNIADGLAAQGFKDIADHIRTLATTPFKNLKDYISALWEHIKSLPNKQGGFIRVKNPKAAEATAYRADLYKRYVQATDKQAKARLYKQWVTLGKK